MLESKIQWLNVWVSKKKPTTFLLLTMFVLVLGLFHHGDKVYINKEIRYFNKSSQKTYKPDVMNGLVVNASM